MKKNMSAAKTSGKIRSKVPSKQMMSEQCDVMSSVPMRTNKGRDMEYKMMLKKR